MNQKISNQPYDLTSLLTDFMEVQRNPLQSSSDVRFLQSQSRFIERVFQKNARPTRKLLHLSITKD